MPGISPDYRIVGEEESTPLAYEAPAPAPKYNGPEFVTVAKDYARPCYLCGVLTIEEARYPRYNLAMHWYCWNQAVQHQLTAGH